MDPQRKVENVVSDMEQWIFGCLHPVFVKASDYLFRERGSPSAARSITSASLLIPASHRAPLSKGILASNTCISKRVEEGIQRKCFYEEQHVSYTFL
jgi:hypothetical protein